MQNKKSKRRRSVYDDVFRTMTVMSSELVLPLLNEMCGDPDRFDGTEKVETLSDDLLLVQPDLEQENGSRIPCCGSRGMSRRSIIWSAKAVLTGLFL